MISPRRAPSPGRVRIRFPAATGRAVPILQQVRFFVDFRGLLESAREHLEVDWVVITPHEGLRIDVGEEFDVQLVVRNTFDGQGSPGFKDIELAIQGTRYAQPVDGARLQIERSLGPGESVKHAVRFRALEADLATEGHGPPERIAEVQATARLDLDPIPDVESAPKILRAQIHGGADPA